MKFAVILPLLKGVPETAKALRRDWDEHVDLPAHVTLGTFEADSPDDVIAAARGSRAMRVRSRGTFVDDGEDAIFAYRAIGCSVIANRVGKAAGSTWRPPKSGLHVTIAWGKRFQRASKSARERVTSTPVEKLDIPCDRAWVYRKLDGDWKKIRSVRFSTG